MEHTSLSELNILLHYHIFFGTLALVCDGRVYSKLTDLE